MSITTADLINNIIKQSSFDLPRDIRFRDRDINSQDTMNKIQSTSEVAFSYENTGLLDGPSPSDSGVAGKTNSEAKASSKDDDLVFDCQVMRPAPEMSMRDSISGIFVQKLKEDKPKKDHRISFLITVQFHHQVDAYDADKYTAYLKPRSRGREFKPETPFEKQIYDLTVENKDWYLGRCTERGPGGHLIEGIALTFNPSDKSLVFWFDDYSPCLAVPTNNEVLTIKQTKFETSGSWGKIQLSEPKKIRFGQSRSTVRGSAL